MESSERSCRIGTSLVGKGLKHQKPCTKGLWVFSGLTWTLYRVYRQQHQVKSCKYIVIIVHVLYRIHSAWQRQSSCPFLLTTTAPATVKTELVSVHVHGITVSYCVAHNVLTTTHMYICMKLYLTCTDVQRTLILIIKIKHTKLISTHCIRRYIYWSRGSGYSCMFP